MSSIETSVVGDIAVPRDVATAIDGVDAVISALGPTTRSADQVLLFENFARTLVDAMAEAGVRRLVSISGAACVVPGEEKPASGRIASALVRLMAGNVVEAKQRELDILLASDLDWIAPRPGRVVEGPYTGNYHAGAELRGMRINDTDLADFMVRQLTDDTYLRQAPYVSS
jgi:putative NADH-flavin reductase